MRCLSFLSILLAAAGCASLPLDGYHTLVIRGVEGGPVEDRAAEAEIVRALTAKDVFPKILRETPDPAPPGEVLLLDGSIGRDAGPSGAWSLRVTLSDAASGAEILSAVILQGDWKLSGPEARLHFLAQRLVSLLRDQKGDKPTDREAWGRSATGDKGAGGG
jgi:hypothetical protein